MDSYCAGSRRGVRDPRQQSSYPRASATSAVLLGRPAHFPGEALLELGSAATFQAVRDGSAQAGAVAGAGGH